MEDSMVHWLKASTLANRLGAQAHLIPRVMFGWPKINTEQSYSVKTKINPTRLIEFRGGCVTGSHWRTGYTCHFSNKPSFSCLFVALLFASTPFSFLFQFLSLVTQFIHPHNVCLPMAIMALQASYYIINSHFFLPSGNVSQYSLGHIPKKEEWMALLISAHLPKLWSITLQNFDWL